MFECSGGGLKQANDQVRSTGDRDEVGPKGAGVCVDGLAMLSVDDETMSVTEKDEVQIRSCSIGLSNESGGTCRADGTDPDN